MSELQNPLFEEEKEFLERKKLEYERALRGDVEHIKDQSVMVGKVALIGAGLAGGIWLITRAFGGKKRKHKSSAKHTLYYDESRYESDYDEPIASDEADSGYYMDGNGEGYEDDFAHKSAADSAKAFVAQYQPEHGHEADDLGFGSTAPMPVETAASDSHGHYHEPSAFDTEDFEDDPFQDLPYDDSRRLPTSHAFDGDYAPAARRSDNNSRSRMIGSVLQAFLQSDTGKVLVGQVAAVALALVTKKVSEFFPAAKNSDLAASSDVAPVETGFLPVDSPATPAFPDASTHTPSA